MVTPEPSTALIAAGTRAVSKRGRPKGTVKYGKAAEDEIIERLGEGETLTRICRKTRDGVVREPYTFPSYLMVYEWTYDTAPSYRAEFTQKFARARLSQTSVWQEECVDIADEPSITFEETVAESEKFGITTKMVRKDHVSRSALRIEARRAAAARIRPHVWEARLQVPLEKPPSTDPEDNTLIIIGGLPETPDYPPCPWPDDEDEPPAPESPPAS